MDQRHILKGKLAEVWSKWDLCMCICKSRHNVFPWASPRNYQINDTINGTKGLFSSTATHSETTSDGKLWGTDRTFSHRALSLVQVHPVGHLGCLTLRPSADKLTAAIQTRSVHPLHPLTGLPGCPILSVPAEGYQSCTCNFQTKSTRSNRRVLTGNFVAFYDLVVYISGSVLFASIIDCATMQACVYASCVSVERHQSSGFVLQGAGLQMQDRRDSKQSQFFFFFVMKRNYLDLPNETSC